MYDHGIPECYENMVSELWLVCTVMHCLLICLCYKKFIIDNISMQTPYSEIV